jgi:hypothetical protein
LDRKELRALWVQNGPSGLNSTFHAWLDGTTTANELENRNNQPESPLFDKYDSTIWPKQFYLRQISRPLWVTSYFGVLCTSCFPKLYMHDFFPSSYTTSLPKRPSRNHPHTTGRIKWSAKILTTWANKSLISI